MIIGMMSLLHLAPLHKGALDGAHLAALLWCHLRQVTTG